MKTKKSENVAETQEEKKEKKNVIKQFVKDIVKPAHMVVDFGNENMKIVYGNLSRKNIEIYGHNIMAVDRELVDDGKIINPLEVATMLKSSIKENDINVKRLTLVLSGSDVIIREIQIPKAEEREIDKIIEFEAQQYFPIELTQYMTDYKILEEITTHDEEKFRILLVAVPLEQIHGYIQVAEFLGIELEAIDLIINTALKYLLGTNYLKEFAASKNVQGVDMSLKSFLNMDVKSLKLAISKLMKVRKDKAAQNEEENKEKEENKEEMGNKEEVENKEEVVTEVEEPKTDEVEETKEPTQDDNQVTQEVINKVAESNFVLLDMGAKTTSIYIYSGHTLKFNRTLLVGGSDVDKKVAQDLTISEKDARNMKISQGNINVDDNPQLYDDAQGLNKAITVAFGNMMDDAGRFLEFYNSRSEEGSIEKMYIYGGASKLRGVREYMTNFFNIPVEYLEKGHYDVSYTGKNTEDYEQNKRVLVNAVGGLIK